MFKKTLHAALLMITLASPALAERPRSSTIYVASIQFPNDIQQVPNIQGFFGGYKISGEEDNDLHRVLFTISTERSMRKLYLLVVEKNSFESEDNTIKYLKIKPTDSYKLWSLELMHKNNTPLMESKTVGGIKFNSEEKSPYFWIIHEETVDEVTGKIPDNTLVVIYDPKFIDHLEGGSSVELPKMVISPNILQLVGSEQNLQDISTRYILSALDCRTIHASCERVVTRHPDASRLTITTT